MRYQIGAQFIRSYHKKERVNSTSQLFATGTELAESFCAEEAMHFYALALLSYSKIA